MVRGGEAPGGAPRRSQCPLGAALPWLFHAEQATGVVKLREGSAPWPGRGGAPQSWLPASLTALPVLQPHPHQSGSSASKQSSYISARPAKPQPTHRDTFPKGPSSVTPPHPQAAQQQWRQRVTASSADTAPTSAGRCLLPLPAHGSTHCTFFSRFTSTPPCSGWNLSSHLPPQSPQHPYSVLPPNTSP